MTGFAVYSSEYTPQRLYADGDTDRIETGLVEEVVRFGDQPLGFYVDLDQRQVLWSFKAERHTKSARTGYFIAVYQGDDGDLFRDFEEQLRGLHDSEAWAIPHTGDPRWDIGFNLWRIPGDLSGLRTDQFQELTDRLGQDVRARPIEFGMRSHRSAFQAVRALDEADVSCTVAVGSGGDAATLSNADLLLRPGAESDFEPLSEWAEFEADESTGKRTGETVSEKLRRGRDRSGSLLSQISGAVLLVFLGFAVYSFIEPSPVQPITGLSTAGGLIGSLVAIAAGTRFLNNRGSKHARSSLRESLVSERDRSVVLLAYGTLLGFGFPRLMWEVGVALGGDGFPFGSITTLFGALPTVGVYVFGVFVVSALLTVAQRTRDGSNSPSNDLLSALALGHVTYALVLVLATGLASSLWFAVIPSAT